jgi:CHAD domain-containing protein
MQPLAQLSRNLPDTVTIREVVDLLEEKYSLHELPARTACVTFFDTFDWRLYEKSRLCSLRDTTIHLTDFMEKELVSPLKVGKKSHRFWWQFPESDIRDTLAGLIDIRALLPQTSFSETTLELQILNKDDKVVATIILAALELKNDKKIHFVQLREVRGYNKWFLKLSRDLADFGEPRPDTGVQTLVTALAAAGRKPMEYSSGFSVPLKTDMESREAAKAIYTNLLTTMQANIQGIVADLDSEFLHDFRVAIRRTRSGLSLIKDVFDPEISKRFKEDFRYLGQITGPVRDLDVYLLMEDNYKARLPEHLQEGLHFFFEDLAKQRSREQKKLVRTLKAPACQSILQDWQEYLENEDNDYRSGNSLKPVHVLANKIISKRFQRILRDGKAIRPDSADEELHRLRIQGKKMRYALEFFSSLYPQQDMKTLIKHFKVLQNNLGDFNDLSVQQEMLKHYLATIRPGTVKSKKLSAAIGGLLTNLYHESRRVRARFEETFARFATRKHLALYHKLFD